MLKFRTHIVGLLAVTAVVGPASVADAKTTRYSAEIVSSALTVTDGYPAVGGTAYLAGSLKSKPFGPGAMIDRVTITGQPWGAGVFTFEGTETAVFAQGTQQSTFTGTSTVLADGTQEIVVNGRLTDGTERFRNATGRYKFSGSIPPGATELTGRSTGRVRY